jgi:calcineurin-like phosphoesterase
MPHSFDVATSDVRLCGAIAEIDEATGRAVSIERVEVAGENADSPYDADDKAPNPGAAD